MSDTEDIQQQNPAPSPEQLTQAATAGPQPSSQLATTLMGTPTTPTPAPAAPAKPAAQQAVEQHHSMLGRVASALLGKQLDYQVDATGKTVAVEVPEKPGSLFRHILAGALLGGAAAKGTNSVIAGFSRGATAGIEANQAGDQQRYARAQQGFKTQQEAQRTQREQQAEGREDQRLKDEQLRTTAQHEMWNKESILHEHDANLRDAEFLQRQNQNSQQLQQWATEAGGIDAPIPGNGTAGNGAAMADLYTRDSGKFRPPQGFNRFITHDIDMNGLTYDPQKGYVDNDGKAVDLKDRTTWKVTFVPQKPQPLEIDGARLNRLFPKTLAGTADPKQTYRLPWQQVVGMATTEHETSRRDADESYKRTHDDLRADMDELKSKANNYTRQADEAERQGDPAAKELRQKAQDAFDEFDEIKTQTNPHSRLRKAARGTGTVASEQAYSQALAIGKTMDYETAVKNIQTNPKIPQEHKDRLMKDLIPPGKAAIYNKWGFVGIVDKADVAKNKKKDTELGNKAGTTYIEGPDAPAPAAPPPSSAAATGAAMQ